MSEKVYKSTDMNKNQWEIGLKDRQGKGKLSGYINVAGHEFILSNFNTKKSALEWWGAFSSILKNKGAEQ